MQVSAVEQDNVFVSISEDLLIIIPIFPSLSTSLIM